MEENKSFEELLEGLRNSDKGSDHFRHDVLVAWSQLCTARDMERKALGQIVDMLLDINERVMNEEKDNG